MTDDPVASSPRKPWRRRLLAIGLALAVGVVLLVVDWDRKPPPSVKLPDPNGYEDLDRAGASIVGLWPNKGDLTKAVLLDVRSFIDANRPSLDRARVGLGRECMAAFDDSQAGLSKHLESSGRIRNVARLMIGEAIVLEADGKFDEAARVYRDVLNVGQAATQGGMGNDLAIGSVVQGQAIGRLRMIRDRLSRRSINEILDDLESLDGRRVTPEAAEARRKEWYRRAFTSWQRTMLRLTGADQQGVQAELSLGRKSSERIAKGMRYFEIELAIHAYHEDKKAWPKSLAALVPDYLHAVPVDPANGKPLDYPANPDGDLTTDLSAVARPDGEVTPRP